jgi:hypothetical protein
VGVRGATQLGVGASGQRPGLATSQRHTGDIVEYAVSPVRERYHTCSGFLRVSELNGAWTFTAGAPSDSVKQRVFIVCSTDSPCALVDPDCTEGDERVHVWADAEVASCAAETCVCAPAASTSCAMQCVVHAACTPVTVAW